MLLLAALDVPARDIAADYRASARFYAAFEAQEDIVAGLDAAGLTRETFLDAPEGLVEHVMGYISARWGSPRAYLQWAGLRPAWYQTALRLRR